MEFSNIFQAKNLKLCLNPNEFVKETFSVDRFLSNNKSNELEAIREDLGLLLKILKKSMIKLINADYQDFIHLSTNLKNLKGNLKNIESPFTLLHSKILKMETIMTNHIVFLEALIAERNNLKVLRKKLHCFYKLKCYFVLTKICEIERVSRYIHFQYYSKINFKKISDRYGKEIIEVNYLVNEKLKTIFNDSISNNRQLESYKILLVCSLLSSNKHVEDVFKQEIVTKFVQTEIAEIIQNKISKQALLNFYKNLLDFIPFHMKELLFVTLYNKRIEGPNFLVNSFWIEVEQQMRNNLPLIFSPGNPELFIARLESTEIFLKKIEKIFGNKKDIKSFRLNDHTKKFLQCWNLSVYFQIRFQEILYDLEVYSQNNANNIRYDLKNKTFKSCFIDKVDKAITMCWSKGIYNSNLFGKFLKLTLQILSRVNIWTHNILNINKSNEICSIDVIALVYVDIDLLIKKIPTYIQTSEKQLPDTLKLNLSLISKCFQYSNAKLLNLLGEIEKKITASLINQSRNNLKYVADLTRMYRKTNREIPIERSTYVHNMNEPFEFFKKTYGSVFSELKLKEILKISLEKVSNEYFNCINDVLLSIKRTEESLRRLKSVRAKSSSFADTSHEQNFVADDHKIKIQLQIDVLYWINKIESHIDEKNIPNLKELLMLVEISQNVTET